MPALTLEERLIRYLKTGTEGSFFLPGKNKKFRMFGNVVDVMTQAGQGKDAVTLIKRVSQEKSYYKREPLLYFLAVATRSMNMEVKRAAYEIVKDVCENPWDLFTYLKHVKILSQLTKGWGNGLRRTVCDWYNSKDPMQLAEFVTRYREVEKWSHHDVFRLSHIKPANEGVAFIVKVVTKGLKAAKEAYPEPSQQIKDLIDYFDAVDLVKHSDDMHAVSIQIEEKNIYLEHIPATALASKEVWNSLLRKMTLKQTLRSLTALGRRGFLTIPSKGEPVDPVTAMIREQVLEKVSDSAAIKQEKISPFLMYIEIRNYMGAFAIKKRHDKEDQSNKTDASMQTKRGPEETGQKDQASKKKKKKKKGSQSDGDKADDQVDGHVANDTDTSLTEKVTKINPTLYEALHAAFRVAVENNLQSLNKRFLIAVKASVAQLGHGIRGTPSISPLEVMALMATFLKKKEKTPQLGCFTSSFSLIKYPSEVEDLIQEIGQSASSVPNEACDPAVPITWALKKKMKVDVFLIMSDGGETQGSETMSDKLTEYREKMNSPDTKVVMCGLTAPRLEFAETNGMLDIGGFDVNVPLIINEFITGTLDR